MRESERDYGFGAELVQGDEPLGADALETLGDEIALMAAHATAVEHASPAIRGLTTSITGSTAGRPP